ncbi:DcuS/MalK family sensor histidine kinase [Texcoconibacillus texcoconensis]|uniref:histidine kinase n=1 Tax=Texcoconibacillus texcoconensis TaxID=1095777 RepID=A0A840QM20_9BACI|nr:DcuS/MalK family sensor histidine kinase [Texcoconibacillus texcoconensis]MBB5172417.1 CitB family two-component system sensor histidine kinase MalK [Texcoconibacillus texcoconensis]
MRLKRPNISLQNRIIFLVCSVAALILLVTSYLSSTSIEDTTLSMVEEKTKSISRMVALNEDVIGALNGEVEQETLQKEIEKIRETTDVLFVVILNMDRERLTHPNPQEVGKKFVGDDEGPVFVKGNEYTSISEGTLGYSFRYFTPVYDDNDSQIGVVTVGVHLDKVENAVSSNQDHIIIGTILSSIIGISASIFLSTMIKGTLFEMEPWQISKVLEERSAMLKYAKEGVIAVDTNCMITFINNEGINYIKKIGHDHDNLNGKNIEEVIPNSQLSKVLQTGKSEVDKELTYNDTTIVTNRVPIYVGNKIVGAIATFRDKTEVKHLAENLTGVKQYAEALRAQTHEFMNRMHVILGMVELKSYDKLAQYIKYSSSNSQNETDFIIKHIKDPVLAGFILGKRSYARESGVELEFSDDCYVPEPNDPELTHDLVTIIGNLIDNSIDAVQECSKKRVSVDIRYQEEFIYIKVSDTGSGMSEREIELSTKEKHSTKGEDRGWGLYLISKIIEDRKGDISFHSIVNSGTDISLKLPYESKE